MPYGEDMTASDSSQPTPVEATITLRANGPLLVQGDVKVIDAEGNEIDRGGRVAFCRCGASKNKPFCDASHKAINFEA
jgi:hypothetical protein